MKNKLNKEKFSSSVYVNARRSAYAFKEGIISYTKATTQFQWCMSFFKDSEDINGQMYVEKYQIKCKLHQIITLKKLEAIDVLINNAETLENQSKDKNVYQPSHTYLVCESLLTKAKLNLYYDNLEVAKQSLVEAKERILSLLDKFYNYMKAIEMLIIVDSFLAQLNKPGE